jgi:NitT/TauT family transport system substrate-binding protein
VREELLAAKPALVQELVNTILGAGVWLDSAAANRTKAAEIAAGKRFFNQDKSIIQFVMDNPSDRVTYGDLRMIREEFDELMRLSVEAGTLAHEVPYENYVDERFARVGKPTSIAI